MGARLSSRGTRGVRTRKKSGYNCVCMCVCRAESRYGAKPATRTNLADKRYGFADHKGVNALVKYTMVKVV